jgi:acyl-CoA synthetase (AMP-forming)/AMP-acid ligase II
VITVTGQPRTIPAMLAHSVRRFGPAVAVRDGDVTLTYAELAERVLAAARGMRALGIGAGDRVGLWAPNSHRWIVASLAVHAAGAVVVPLNTRYRGPEAREILARVRATAVLVDDGFLGYGYADAVTTVLANDLANDEVGDALAGLTVVDLGRDRAGAGATVLGWGDLLAAGASVGVDAARAAADAVSPTDLSEIIFTSGTTGRPKGVTIPHGTGLDLYRAYGEVWGLREGDRYLVTLPFFHTGGNKAGMLVSLMYGLTIVPMAVFDATEALRLIEQERISVMNGPPTIYYSLLESPDLGEYDVSSLRVAATGAAVVPVALVERARTELPFDRFVTAYGMTECFGTATMCRATDSPDTIARTSGRAVPGVQLRVVDPSGKDTPLGVPGEVLIKGPNVTPGYWEDPAATAAAIDADGWLHSGDVGTLDEQGNLTITDRIKDLFIVGGFNVSPAEVEQTMARHPSVAEVAVVGIPDERLGEVAKAFVIPRQGAEVAPAEVIDWVRERLANFKVPRVVEVVGELPRNASGKVLRRELRRREGTR